MLKISSNFSSHKNKKYKRLSYLNQSKNKAISRKAIMEQISYFLVRKKPSQMVYQKHKSVYGLMKFFHHYKISLKLES